MIGDDINLNCEWRETHNALCESMDSLKKFPKDDQNTNNQYLSFAMRQLLQQTTFTTFIGWDSFYLWSKTKNPH